MLRAIGLTSGMLEATEPFELVVSPTAPASTHDPAHATWAPVFPSLLFRALRSADLFGKSASRPRRYLQRLQWQIRSGGTNDGGGRKGVKWQVGAPVSPNFKGNQVFSKKIGKLSK